MVQHKNSTVKCHECGMLLSNERALQRHLPTHEPTVCIFCGKHVSKKMLSKHMLIHSERRYTCDICGKKFAQPAALSQHMQLHSDQKRYTCEKCGKQYAQAVGLRQHKQVCYSMEENSPFSVDISKRTCNICSKVFTQVCSLNAHKRTVHDEGAKYKCNICGRNCLNYKKLEEHKLVHTKDKQHPCTYCDKYFKYERSLVQHLERKHNSRANMQKILGDAAELDLSEFTCHICSKVFNNRFSYKGHLRIHDLVVCTVCGRDIVRDRLPRHLQRHADESAGIVKERTASSRKERPEKPKKPVVCKLCGKVCQDHDEMYYHVKELHNEVLRYSCPICNKICWNRRNYKQHRNKHNEGNPYSCEICGKTFKFRSSVVPHMKRTHQQEHIHSNPPVHLEERLDSEIAQQHILIEPKHENLN